MTAEAAGSSAAVAIVLGVMSAVILGVSFTQVRGERKGKVVFFMKHRFFVPSAIVLGIMVDASGTEVADYS
jgi:hypothetical protein